MSPSRLLESLLHARSLAYRFASPIESLGRALLGARRLPPLWLRRHTGSPRRFVSAAEATLSLLDRLGLIAREGQILDIGCGCGAMALALQNVLAADGKYCGFDVHEPSIRWCLRSIGQDQRFTFHLANVRSPYSYGSGTGAKNVEAYEFPLASGGTELVIAKSIFTHLKTEDLSHYLREINRVLSPSGSCFSTFFLFEGKEPAQIPAFPYPQNSHATMRWRRNLRPEAAIAYERSYITSLAAESGLEVTEMIPGFWPGKDPRLTGQDQLVLRKA